jgi:hypothetical protein
MALDDGSSPFLHSMAEQRLAEQFRDWPGQFIERVDDTDGVPIAK